MYLKLATKQLPSGLFLVEEAPPDPRYDVPGSLPPNYDDAHRCCPRCNNSNLLTTTMGVLGAHYMNRADCDCGWKGYVDDLVSLPIDREH
jgi:hypothetical protein